MSILGQLFSVPDDDWVQEAICAQTDADAFHPEKGASANPAKRICASCPVIKDCLQYALDNDERGVWGGMTESERRRFKAGKAVRKTHCRPNGHGFACKCVVCRRAA